ncbi:MAG: hypothetical protein C0511_07105 [Hyphomicrobium sp.]|jgi:hypothetical protein|nr:MAG: hypothetical protein FD172_3949 [Methylocystaceae bacterium]MBA4172411.1 hypothetical protein [Hyphomicrobium sp.]
MTERVLSMWVNPRVSYEDKLKALTLACLQANPELVKRIESRPNCAASASDVIGIVDIKVLLMKDVSDRRCLSNIETLSCWWNFKKDALSSQSDECIGFLYETLLYLTR